MLIISLIISMFSDGRYDKMAAEALRNVKAGKPPPTTGPGSANVQLSAINKCVFTRAHFVCSVPLAIVWVTNTLHVRACIYKGDTSDAALWQCPRCFLTEAQVGGGACLHGLAILRSWLYHFSASASVQPPRRFEALPTTRTILLQLCDLEEETVKAALRASRSTQGFGAEAGSSGQEEAGAAPVKCSEANGWFSFSEHTAIQAAIQRRFTALIQSQGPTPSELQAAKEKAEKSAAAAAAQAAKAAERKAAAKKPGRPAGRGKGSRRGRGRSGASDAPAAAEAGEDPSSQQAAAGDVEMGEAEAGAGPSQRLPAAVAAADGEEVDGAGEAQQGPGAAGAAAQGTLLQQLMSRMDLGGSQGPLDLLSEVSNGFSFRWFCTCFSSLCGSVHCAVPLRLWLANAAGRLPLVVQISACWDWNLKTLTLLTCCPPALACFKLCQSSSVLHMSYAHTVCHICRLMSTSCSSQRRRTRMKKTAQPCVHQGSPLGRGQTMRMKKRRRTKRRKRRGMGRS